MDVPAVVTRYDPSWPGLFRRLRDRLDAALAGVAHVTEHVGSTAVRGLDAKPIIDVDVVVADETAVGPAVRMPPITICTWSWREAGRIAITLTFVTSCGRIPATPPGTAS